ncbi:hypothetical protein, partial [Burkholderia anthina]|uniref:hypothetical protein n=1 Tax=Burkholderia anthina TaxID=179879 RepID=UPI001ABBB04A
ADQLIRTAVYGPVRTVVREGSGREACPYPNFCASVHASIPSETERHPLALRRAVAASLLQITSRYRRLAAMQQRVAMTRLIARCRCGQTE